MSIRLAALSGRTAKIDVTFQGETCAVEYRPNYMTPERQAVLTAANEEGVNTDGFLDLVCGIIASWDVLDDNGEPLPVTPEVAKTFPFSFLSAVITATAEATQPGEAVAP